MRSLKEENKEAYKYHQTGGFSGSLSGRPHSRIPFDQVIEMTINRSCKQTGDCLARHRTYENRKVDQYKSFNGYVTRTHGQ